jgi:hypothetical protein
LPLRLRHSVFSVPDIARSGGRGGRGARAIVGNRMASQLGNCRQRVPALGAIAAVAERQESVQIGDRAAGSGAACRRSGWRQSYRIIALSALSCTTHACFLLSRALPPCARSQRQAADSPEFLNGDCEDGRSQAA